MQPSNSGYVAAQNDCQLKYDSRALLMAHGKRERDSWTFLNDKLELSLHKLLIIFLINDIPRRVGEISTVLF